MKIKVLATSLLLSVASAAAYGEDRVATFDLGSLDTLDELGLSEQVVGVPQQNLPDYLSQYEDERYTDIGGLRSPDIEALNNSKPHLIFFTGRQGEWQQDMEVIAPLLNTSVQGDDYLTAFDDNVRQIASRLHAEARAEEALEELHAHIEEQRQALANAPRVLVATHNQGGLTLNTHPVVHDVLGLETLDMPDSVTSETRGSRTFTPLSSEAIAEIKPDVILIVDRSAAIGDEPADMEALEHTLADAGASDVRLVSLTPALWYLSGGGLQSLKMQIDEVVEAL
ncbi:ABC transporter substrate-binding protein [Vreelandella populi]|uniref:ABC transporter substrate-binding protein n=1 Tax=Vreelandella populi TaxID=2498858 RepID=A0A433LEK3_9GAMM|nr:ABC transporter substrate-binding protein [Halomonas populi]RUR35350.1 ABC transporter substrate-binding protein [Halomonas populi]RUR47541.1 ABC transporter substrate-binding protein [Halomonas populi]RUR54591.1 ABC transporter substrate-binding protein [Halomonas populi]